MEQQSFEELRELLVQEQEKNKALEAEKAQLAKNNAELEDKNKSLTDYNQKLFMRITTPEKQEEDKPVDDEETIISRIAEQARKKL